MDFPIINLSIRTQRLEGLGIDWRVYRDQAKWTREFTQYCLDFDPQTFFELFHGRPSGHMEMWAVRFGIRTLELWTNAPREYENYIYDIISHAGNMDHVKKGLYRHSWAEEVSRLLSCLPFPHTIKIK